jgi:hypothetical protein
MVEQWLAGLKEVIYNALLISVFKGASPILSGLLFPVPAREIRVSAIKLAGLVTNG